jgi:phospholipase/carboxylesterase
MNDGGGSDLPYLRAILTAAEAARRTLAHLESTAERLAPQRLAALAGELDSSCTAVLREARGRLDAAPVPDDMRRLHERFEAGLRHVETAVTDLLAASRSLPPESIEKVLSSWHETARAQEMLYPLRTVLPPLRFFWDLPGAAALPDAPVEEGVRVGITHVGAGGHHGGLSLYVPEHYRSDRDWPVIVALHGGSGNGRDFLWTWLREARSLGYILVTPSAAGNTWSDVEERGLLEILAWLAQRYRIDRRRILLTGLSDGATFGLLYGLAHPDVFRAIAPLCGVLHPANEAIGNLQRAKNVPIYLVHGALDFIFPVMLARAAAETLRAAGAALTYRELPELSHTYPRSENLNILRWLEALPPR